LRWEGKKPRENYLIFNGSGTARQQSLGEAEGREILLGF